MARPKSTPSKRPLASAASKPTKRQRYRSALRERTAAIFLSSDVGDGANSLRLQFPLNSPPYSSLLAVLRALCSELNVKRLSVYATLSVGDQVTLQTQQDPDQSQQLPFAELFPGVYDSFLPHVATLVELQLLALHVVAIRKTTQDDWSFHLSVTVAWRKYMEVCSSRGLLPVLVPPRASPAKAMHHVMIWLLKQVRDAELEVEEGGVKCRFRYWNEVEVLYDRYVGANASVCKQFEDNVFEMPEIYARIDAARQLARDVSTYEAIESSSKDLLPTLRPYQRAAVSWMLSREMNELKLRPKLPLGVTFCELSTPGLEAYDPFCAAFHSASLAADTQDQLRPMTLKLEGVSGGILADEMGLGKTVEVIALMLSHRRHSTKPKLLSVHSHQETTGGAKFEEGVMACICGSEEEQSLGLVQCDFCGTWHHRLCTGFETESSLAGSSIGSTTLGLWNFEAPSVWPDRGFMCYQCQSFERPVLETHATLIVSPEPIHAQWQNELSRHVRTGTLSVIRYPGVRAIRSRLETTGPSAEWQILASLGLFLSRYDVILTTYEALVADLRYVPTAEGGVRRASTRCKHKRYTFVGSPLVGLHFWRVCMDEAQVGVENTRLQAALTVAQISAKYRWVVTGTPFSSRVNELFGYLRFLRIAPYTLIREAKDILQLRQDQTARIEAEGLDLAFFREAFERCFTRGAVERVLDLLLWNGGNIADTEMWGGGGILWRSGKKHVLDQLGLPPQRNEVVWCRFAAVERHFYDQQEKRIVTTVQQRQREQSEKWKENNLIDRDDRLWQDLLVLRQLCCHPQVGSARQAWAASGNSTGGTVMTMDAFLHELVTKAKRECEEAQRQLVGAQNGLAALLVLEHNFSGAALKYLALMRVIRTNWTQFRADLLPRLHILQNLEKCVQALYTLPENGNVSNGSGSNNDAVDPKTMCTLPELPFLEKRVSATGLDPDSEELGDHIRVEIARECSLLGQSARHIRQYYLFQIDGLHAQALSGFREISEKIDSEQEQQVTGGDANTLCTAGRWWNDALAIIEQGTQHDQQQIVTRVQARLAGFGTRWGTAFCSQLVSVRSLRLLLVRELELLANRRRKLFTRLAALSENTPTDDDVELSGNCAKCRDGGTGPTCVHCQLYKDLEAYRQHFLGVDKNAAGKTNILDALIDDEGDIESDAGEPMAQTGGVSKSLFMEVFKEIAGCARNALRSYHGSRGRASDIQAALQQETEFWVKLQREWQAAKKLFQTQHQRLGALDELVMACTQLRLRQPGEPEDRTKAERLYKLEPAEVPVRANELEVDRAVAEHELHDKISQLRYLVQLQGESEARQIQQPQENDKSLESSTTFEPSVCAVCLQELTRKRAMFPCAHVFCRACASNLAGGKHKRNNVRCPTCRRVCPVERITEIVDESNANAAPDPNTAQPQLSRPHHAGGGLGSKIDALLGRMDALRQENPTVKCLLFSQWGQMLELAVQALPRLGVRCFMYSTKRKLPALLTQFQVCPAACVLALPFKVGANGLNIVEATEVLLIEPLLSPSIEAQAVNRVHRLGQTRQTRVHRFIVQGSIEERIYRLGHKSLGDEEVKDDDEELPRLGVAPGRKEQEKLTVQDLQELLHGQVDCAPADPDDVASETAVAFWEELVLMKEKRFTRRAACELLERRRASELRADPNSEATDVKTALFGKNVALVIADELLELPYTDEHTTEGSTALAPAIRRHKERIEQEIRVWRSF